MENKKLKIDNVSFHEGKLCLELTNGCMVYIDGGKFSIESSDVINEAPIADVKQRLQKLSTQHCYRAFEESFNNFVATLPFQKDTQITIHDVIENDLSFEKMTLTNGCFEATAYMDDLFDDEKSARDEFNRYMWMYQNLTGIYKEMAFHLFQDGTAFLHYNPESYNYTICFKPNGICLFFYNAIDYIMALLVLLQAERDMCKPRLIFALFQSFQNTKQWLDYTLYMITNHRDDDYYICNEYCMFIAGKLAGFVPNNSAPLHYFRDKLFQLAQQIGYQDLIELQQKNM